MKIKNLFEEELPYSLHYENAGSSLLFWKRKGGDLSGSPKELVGEFHAAYCVLESLNGGPKTVFGDFSVHHNRLESLEGGPEMVTKDYICSNNSQLKSLKGAPDSSDIFSCDFCSSLESIEGAPQKVHSVFGASHCALTSMKGSPKFVGSANLSNNKLTNFEGAPNTIHGDLLVTSNLITSLIGISDNIKTLNGTLDVSRNDIVEGGLELLLIDGLQGVKCDGGANENFLRFLKIINRELRNGNKDIYTTQNELIEAGLERFAQI